MQKFSAFPSTLSPARVLALSAAPLSVVADTGLVINRRLLRVRRRSGLRNFGQDLRSVGPVFQRLPRLQTVAISDIVGSVGRARELARDFRPRRIVRRPDDEARLETIRSMMERGCSVPSIELYRLGDDYYVVDGHHRVAAARLIGQLESTPASWSSFLAADVRRQLTANAYR